MAQSMDSDNKKITTINHEILFHDLTEVIDKKHNDLLRVCNSELIILFWKVGQELNRLDKKEKLTIRLISNRLVANYGQYFSDKNLKKMRQFAQEFPDLTSVIRIAPFLSWEYIIALLKINSFEAKLFYIERTFQEGLGVKVLSKQISSKHFSQRKTDKVNKEIRLSFASRSNQRKKNNQKLLKIFQSGLKQIEHNNQIIENIFQAPLLSNFRELMAPSKGFTMFIKKGRAISAHEDEPIEQLSQIIEEYRYNQNRWLNVFLNLSFWEIGKRMNQENLLDKKSVHSVSVQLKKRYKKNYSEKKLGEMSKFAEQFSDLNITTEVAYLVSWQHILVLQSLDEMGAKLFYATLTATRGLTVSSLKQQIAKNIYGDTSEKIRSEYRKIFALHNGGIKKEHFKMEKHVGNLNSMEFDKVDNIRFVTNIFKNSYLFLLV